MRLSVRLPAAALAAWLGAAPVSAQVVLSEGFNASHVPAGWVNINNSQFPETEGGWFRPPGPFADPTGPNDFPPAHQGGVTQYTAAAFTSTTGVNAQNQPVPAVISNWLITPPLNLTRDAQVSFFTRTVNNNLFGDRLQVWLSPADTSARAPSAGPVPIQGAPNIAPGDQVPQTNGDFTVKLLDINPNEVQSGPERYPEQWTQFTMSFSAVPGLPQPLTGARIGFRYYAEDGGPNGTSRPANGNRDFTNFVGIDTVTINAVPEPTALALGGTALPAIAWVIRRRRDTASTEC